MSKKKEVWVALFAGMLCIATFQGIRWYRAYQRYTQAGCIAFNKLKDISLLGKKDGYFLKVTTLDGKKHLLDDAPFPNLPLAKERIQFLIEQKKPIYNYDGVLFSERSFPVLSLCYLTLVIALMLYFFGLWVFYGKG